MTPETYTDWTLVSLSPLPDSWKVIATVLVIGATLTVLASYRHSRRRLILGSLRVMAALLLLGFLLEPALQTRIVRRVRNRLAIIVDRSESMGLALQDGTTRYEAVLSVLNNSPEDLKTLAESHIIEFYDLDGPISDSTLNQPPAGETTDLLRALETAQATGGGQPLAGIVLISDGADNTDLTSRGRPQLPPQIEERLQQLSVPVNTVLVANPRDFRDVAISEVNADEFAFVHNTIEIEVTLEVTGYGNLTVPVSLKQGDQLLATQEAVIQTGSPTTLRFTTKPESIGEFVYTVTAPTFSGEAITDNNHRSFVIKVIRDKIRVLQVAGRPSWDERFLRQHLKENPNVDLISFFILRTPTDEPSVPEKELSLIPFPTQKIFDSELHTFDVVIFQNFDYRPYRMSSYLPNIRDAVKNGLGFVMVGGEQSFAGGGYLGTPIDEILPINLQGGGIVQGQHHLRLTPAGVSHPITQLTRSGNSQRVWKNLPGWRLLNRTGGLMPEATSLATTGADQPGAGLPLISVREVGEGRTMAIASESMWQWRFSNNRDGGASERAYHRFWSNALRWLVRDPEHSRVQVLPSRRHFDIDDEVVVTFKVLNQDYQPMALSSLRATLSQNQGGSTRIDDLTTDENGIARYEYGELAPGAYRITASARSGPGTESEGQDVFIVESRSIELTRGSPRPTVLSNLATATDGVAASLDDDFWKQLHVIDPEVVEVDKRRNTELWDNVWALLIGIGLIALEWSMRRRHGYV